MLAGSDRRWHYGAVKTELDVSTNYNAGQHPPLLIDDDEEFGVPRGVLLLAASIAIAWIALVAAVFVVDFSGLSVVFVLVASWTWVLGGGLLVAGPLLYQIRLRRVRSRRAELQRSEWLVNELSEGRLSATGFESENTSE